ncbi:MAG: RNA 2',3'-cyclic phosphodiesterase [Proteobacteria bacterium]|nr:RNA 2',3'-cyclic phosphodiesterase [Pseudomonadota bacterium]
MKRIFIAVDVEDELKHYLEKLIDEIGGLNIPSIRLVKPENIHITLKFLGEVEDDRVDDIIEALTGIDKRFNRKVSKILGIGAFPNMRRPHVLWLGIDDGKEQFSKMADFINNSLSIYGFTKNSRPFSPHLTLGRFKKPISNLNSYVGKLNVPDVEFGINRITIYESKLFQTGPVYTAIKHFTLTRRKNGK